MFFRGPRQARSGNLHCVQDRPLPVPVLNSKNAGHRPTFVIATENCRQSRLRHSRIKQKQCYRDARRACQRAFSSKKMPTHIHSVHDTYPASALEPLERVRVPSSGISLRPHLTLRFQHSPTPDRLSSVLAVTRIECRRARIAARRSFPSAGSELNRLFYSLGAAHGKFRPRSRLSHASFCSRHCLQGAMSMSTKKSKLQPKRFCSHLIATLFFDPEISRKTGCLSNYMAFFRSLWLLRQLFFPVPLCPLESRPRQARKFPLPRHGIPWP